MTANTTASPADMPMISGRLSPPLSPSPADVAVRVVAAPVDGTAALDAPAPAAVVVVLVVAVLVVMMSDPQTRLIVTAAFKCADTMGTIII